MEGEFAYRLVREICGCSGIEEPLRYASQPLLTVVSAMSSVLTDAFPFHSQFLAPGKSLEECLDCDLLPAARCVSGWS